MREPRRLPLVLALAVALLVSACGQGEGGSDGEPDGSGSTEDSTLVIAVGGEPNNLNPIFGDIFGTIYGDHWPLFSSLLAYDADLQLRPDLAADLPEVSDDGLTVTVTLRDDVAFHDGEPFDAADVVFTYESILDPDVGTRTRDLLYDSLERVEAVDDHTVRFALSRPDPAFADKLTTGIIPVHLLEGEDLNTAGFNVDPVGTGPFVLEEWAEGERMVWTANPGYHLGEVGIERVVVTFVGDENTRVSQLEAGAIDVDAVGLAPRVAERFADSDRYEVVRIPGELLALTIPTTDPRFADAEVRRALGTAIDRESVVEGIFGDAGRAVSGPFPPQHWAHDDTVSVDFDPDGAAAVLAAHGWEPGADGVLERDGERLAFDLVYGEASTTQDAALAVRDYLAAIGVEVTLEALGHADRQERIADGAASLQTLGNSFDPELDVFTTYHSSLADDDPGTNPAQVRDEAVDRAIADGRSTSDREARAAAYADLQRALAEQGSWHYLLQGDNLLVVSRRVTGIDPAVAEGHIHGFSRGLLHNIAEWRLDGD